MVSILAVPGPLKTFFDKFPLKTFEYVNNEDEAMDYQMSQRSASFEGPDAVQSSKDDVFQLGVYQIVRDSETGVLLASDPWGLFAELSLSKKNNLKLPREGFNANGTNTSTKRRLQHSMCVLSPRASVTKSLPILVEGFTKRHVRSTESINEILYSRIPTGEHTMYLKLLNTIVYDGYIVDLLCNVPSNKFCDLYAHINEREASVTNWVTIQDTKTTILERNGFQIRHEVLSKYLVELKYPVRTPRVTQLVELSENIILETINCLERLQTHWKGSSKSEPDSTTNLNKYQYIDLALVSYILAIAQLGSESVLNQWLQTNGQYLLQYSYQLLKTCN